MEGILINIEAVAIDLVKEDLGVVAEHLVDSRFLVLGVPTMLNETFIFFGYECDKITVISLLLFVGAVGKSAQIGLHT